MSIVKTESKKRVKKTESKSTSLVKTSEEKKLKIVKEKNNIILDEYFIVKEGLFDIIRRSALKQVNTLLLGPTGQGKTELVYYLAKSLDLPLTIFDMSTMSDPIMSLIGAHTIDIIDGEQRSKFVPSRFSQVIQQPGIVLLDELSRAEHGATNILFPCLDFRRELPMEYCFSDCSPIKVHPKCCFFATANVGAEYSGVKKIDRALLDRFLTLETDKLSEGDIDRLIKNKYQKLSETQCFKIINTYLTINKLFSEFKCSFELSPRHLKQICELVEDDFTIYDSFYNIAKGLGSVKGIAEVISILTEIKND